MERLRHATRAAGHLEKIKAHREKLFNLHDLAAGGEDHDSITRLDHSVTANSQHPVAANDPANDDTLWNARLTQRLANQQR